MINPFRFTLIRALCVITRKFCCALVMIGASALCSDSFVAVKAKSPSYALSLPASGSLTANPSPIQVCDGSGLGVTTLSWTSNGTSVVEVHLDEPTGMLLATTGPSGTVTTGKWVGNATQFFLQDVSGGLPLSPENTLATVTVYLTGCSSPGDEWTNNSNNINNTNTGNVGIGTSGPVFKLDVRGGQINSAEGLCIAGDCKSAWSQVGGAGSSQWTSVGSNISFTTGNVGVGTGSPGARLDIGGGNLRVQSGTLDLNNQIRDDSINLWGGSHTLGIRPWTFVARTDQKFRFESALSNSTLSAYELGSTAGATFFAVKNDGNVGIGTPLPAAPLHISSANNPNLLVDAYATGSNLRFRRAGGTPSAPTAVQNGDVLGNFNFTGYGTTGFATGGRVIWQALAAENWTDTAQGAYVVISTTSTGSAVASERMRITSAGNVGIGTTSPGYTLDVAGQIRSSTGGFVFPDGTVQITAATGGGGGAVNSVFGRTGAVVQQAGDYTWAQITKTSSSLGDLTTRSAGDLNAGTVPIARLGVSGIPDATTFLRGDNTWAPVTGGPSQWTTTSGTNNISYNSGNVGIGTTTPGTQLHIVRPVIGQAVTVDTYGAAPDIRFRRAEGTVANPSAVTFNKAIGAITAVGYGTNGFSPFRGLISFNASENWTDSAQGTFIAFYNTATGGTTTSEKMRIDPSGNVGIGTTAPLFKLDVNGEINATGLRINGTPISTGGPGGPVTWAQVDKSTSSLADIQTRNAGDLNSGTVPIGRIGVSGIPDATTFLRGDNTWATVTGGPSQWASGTNNISYNAGNVGIGTASPGARLDIGGGNLRVQSGTLDLNNQVRDDSINLWSGSYTLGIRPWTFVARTDQKFRFESALSNSTQSAYELGSTAGATFFAVKNDGNVGIGTTSPGAKLEVVGNVNVTGTGNITAAGTIEGGNIKAKYQDVAEWVESSQELSAGTLVVLDHTKSNQVIASSQAYDTRVAGVISAQPGIALGESGDSKVLVATTGRVRIKVDATSGPIQVGDLLVTSNIPGMAMKSEPVNLGGVQLHRPGTIVGKALEPLTKGKGEILVLLSLQ